MSDITPQVPPTVGAFGDAVSDVVNPADQPQGEEAPTRVKLSLAEQNAAYDAATYGTDVVVEDVEGD